MTDLTIEIKGKSLGEYGADLSLFVNGEERTSAGSGELSDKRIRDFIINVILNSAHGILDRYLSVKEEK